MVSELANYLAGIEDFRGQISGLLAELPAQALNWRPIEGTDDHATNSLAVLEALGAGAEHFWIAEVIGHRPKTRDRAAEFATVAISAEPIMQPLQETEWETRDIFSALGEPDLDGGDRTVPVRSSMIRVIDRTPATWAICR